MGSRYIYSERVHLINRMFDFLAFEMQDDWLDVG